MSVSSCVFVRNPELRRVEDPKVQRVVVMVGQDVKEEPVLDMVRRVVSGTKSKGVQLEEMYVRQT